MEEVKSLLESSRGMKMFVEAIDNWMMVFARGLEDTSG
jgi:hypothetical protein